MDPVRCGKAIFFRREGWGDELDVLPIKPTFDLPDGDSDSAGAKLQEMFREHSGQFLKEDVKKEAATEASKDGNEAAKMSVEGKAGLAKEIKSGAKAMTSGQVSSFNDALIKASQGAAMKAIAADGAPAEGENLETGQATDVDQARGLV